MALQNFGIKPIKDFLSDTYLIPDYQREYSWGKEELEDLWDDLIYLENNIDDKHFFGQVVVNNTEKEKYIIDGQQRATTSTILICVIMREFENIYNNSDHQFQKAYKKAQQIQIKLVGTEDEDDEQERFHITLGEIDNLYFKKNILEKELFDSKEKYKSHTRLKEAYLYFKEKVSSHISDNDINKKYDKLISLYNAFTSNFIVMYIESTDINEAFVIFETLNARGKDLETADLLKNYIFRSSGKYISEVKSNWLSIIETLDKVNITSYIRHFYNFYGEFTREKELYRRISKSIHNEKDCKQFVDKLLHLSPVYNAITAPEDNTFFEKQELRESLNNLKTLKAKTFYPIILAADLRKFSEDEIYNITTAIESLVFRNFSICGITANKYEKIFTRIASHIYHGQLTAEEACNEIRNEIIDDDQFSQIFKKFKTKTKSLIRYILVKIANKYQNETNIALDFNKIHIEHIMPENNSKWEISEKDHTDYLWRLGNLTLLGANFNKRNSNKKFSEKKKGYSDSDINLTKKLLTYDDWGVKQIQLRQEELTAMALSIWTK